MRTTAERPARHIGLAALATMLGVAGATCPRCGSPLQTGASYCARCGARLGDASGAPPPTVAVPWQMPPRADLIPKEPAQDRAKLAIILLVVCAVVIAAFGVAFWINSALIPPNPCDGTCPKTLAVVTGKTGDGTNWTLTFASVPAGLTPTNTYMSLSQPNGMMMMTGMTLAGMTGGMVMMQGGAGQLYLKYQGVTADKLSVSDMIVIGTTLSMMGGSTQGWTVTLTNAGSIMYLGTLQ